MSYQAVSWALYSSRTLLTAAGKPDTTARAILTVLAEHAQPDGTDIRPSVLRISWATGFDERTVQRALARLEAARVIIRTGMTREGVVRWQLNLVATRPDTEWAELEAESDRRRDIETTRRRNRRDRSGTPDVSGTQNPGHIETDVSISAGVRDANARTPGFSVPASGTQSTGVRDATPPELPMNHPENHPTTTPGGTLPPDPLRPDAPPTSGHRNDHRDSRTQRAGTPQPLQGDPPTARARETADAPIPSAA